MLSDCLKACKEYGLDKVLITCLQENEGSKRTKIANGGIYESTVYDERESEYLERYWVNL